MIHYQVTMQHSEKTMEKLAHMQYDLFCQKNRLSRSAISVVCMAAGVINFSKWWGALLIVYASYLWSSAYASANHTARKICKGIKASGLGFPQSRYEFQDHAMTIITLPENTSLGEPLFYGDVLKLGEDPDYFYLFRNPFGGYMLPKAKLGEKEDDFRYFIEEKTGKRFRSNAAPVIKLMRRLSRPKIDNSGKRK